MRQGYIPWGKDSLFNKSSWEKWKYGKKKKTGLFSHSIYKINSKWTKELNIRPGTIKVLEEIIGSKPFAISLQNIFFYMSPQAN